MSIHVHILHDCARVHEIMHACAWYMYISDCVCLHDINVSFGVRVHLYTYDHMCVKTQLYTYIHVCARMGTPASKHAHTSLHHFHGKHNNACPSTKMDAGKLTALTSLGLNLLASLLGRREK